MFKVQDNEKAVEFASEFLKRYTAIGFGALSKREVDLMLLQLLQDYLPGFKSKSDFDAALLLKTTKRKVRGLRDEISYREVQDTDQLNKNLRDHLKAAEVLPGNHGMVMIQLDDAVLRGFAEKTVRSEFGIVDSSFNSSIMQLSGEKFLFLAYTVLNESERQQADEAVKKIQLLKGNSTNNAKATFAQFKDGFVMGVGNKVGQLCVSGGMALVTGGSSLLLEGGEIVKATGNGISEALRHVHSLFDATTKD